MLYQKRQPKTPISKQIIENVIESLSINILDYEKEGISYTNDVFKLTNGTDEYYLKFYTDQWLDPNAGKNEEEGAKILKDNGIPTSNILQFGYADIQSPRNWALMEKIPGKPIKYMLPGNIDLQVIKESTETLKKMALINGPMGFIFHDKNIHKTYDNHFDFINDTVWYAFKKLTDFEYDIKNTPALFEQCRKYDIQEKYTFCHNDFTPKHIFTNNHTITGILDLEWAIYSDKTSDMALWITSLAEYGASKENIRTVFDYALNKIDMNKFSYYTARKLILAAAWPHKNTGQPYYSQTCLDKANNILKTLEIKPEDLEWKKGIGVIL